MSASRSGGARIARSRSRPRRRRPEMLLRPFLNDAGSCASYLFGCTSHAKLAVVDPHADFVDDYLVAAAAVGAPITAVFETHVQADHVSGLPALVERTGAIGYLPAGAGVAHGQARILHSSLRRLLELPDHVVLYPSHYGGSVCGRGLSGNPISSIGFERIHNPLLAVADPEAFADALLEDV